MCDLEIVAKGESTIQRKGSTDSFEHCLGTEVCFWQQVVSPRCCSHASAKIGQNESQLDKMEEGDRGASSFSHAEIRVGVSPCT